MEISTEKMKKMLEAAFYEGYNTRNASLREGWIKSFTLQKFQKISKEKEN